MGRIRHHAAIFQTIMNVFSVPVGMNVVQSGWRRGSAQGSYEFYSVVTLGSVDRNNPSIKNSIYFHTAIFFFLIKKKQRK